MKIKVIIGILLTGYVVLCAALVVESGLFKKAENTRPVRLRSGQAPPVVMLASEATLQAASPPPSESTTLEEDEDQYKFTGLQAVGGRPRTFTLGSVDPSTGYKFHLDLSTKGAAIRKATLSEFNERNGGEERLILLAPVMRRDGSRVMSMASGDFIFVNEGLKLRLDRLDWECSDVVEGDDSQSVRLEAVIRNASGNDMVRLTKSYTVMRDCYHLECEMKVENLTGGELSTRFEIEGPEGIQREGTRVDARKIVGGFVGPDGKIAGIMKQNKTPMLGGARNKVGLEDATRMYQEAQAERDKTRAKEMEKAALGYMRIKPPRSDMRFLWAASTNKYFAAILRPVPKTGSLTVDWLKDKIAWYYDIDESKEGDETLGFRYIVDGGGIEAGGARRYKFQLYLGPKDKGLFEKKELYRQLGFYHTITFLSCCCPAGLVNPLSFGILAVMKWMYGVIPNYGIVIIIFVFVVRLILHPITKKSQVSMMKMQKLGPKVEQIKKQYEHNKAEMNRRVMELYKDQGAVPIMGCLPMFLQMPIWIALYSAIYASVELRGAAFLPVWITDLSAPDALVSFAAIKLPLLGKVESLNLLPILLGVGMFLQQKLMPHAASQSAANPQVAQQQKMMQIMLPIMMLLFLYNAPSGLNLYIMASTFAGIIEQQRIRKHREEVEEKEADGLVDVTSKTGGKVKKKKPKPWIRY